MVEWCPALHVLLGNRWNHARSILRAPAKCTEASCDKDCRPELLIDRKASSGLDAQLFEDAVQVVVA